MHPDIKYLGIGLLIGIGIAAIAITGIFFAGFLPTGLSPLPDSESAALPEQPASIPVVPATATFFMPDSTLTPTSTPTNIPAISSTQFNVPSPMPTLGAAQSMINAGQILPIGPLSEEQQKNLYDMSMIYVEPTTRGSLYLSKEINGVKYGNASNTCGPLAIAILRDAGIINEDVNAHDFWLLNPDVPANRKILDRTFPLDRFIHTETRYPFTKINWRDFPLMPGDFVYIKAGTGGNFDHMLTVNRVDNKMRAYAVSNYKNEYGFIITEVLLYDPNDSQAGIFHTWTQRPNQVLGSTGFGGMEIWRLRSPGQLVDPTPYVP
jgi:hypothetical protein